MPLIEQIASYWDRVPCGSRHINPTEQRYFTQPHIRAFADFRHWKGKRVLEIGCGIGTDTVEFLRAGVRSISAVDISSESLAIAAKRSYDYSRSTGARPCAWFCPANAEEFLPAGIFDLIYSFGVLHHTPHPEKVLALAHDKLAEDGELRIMLYAKWSWKHLFTGQQPEAQAGCPLVRWYSMREARGLVESCGFEVVSIEKRHIFPWKISKYIERKYARAFPWNIVPEYWLEPYLGHHLLIQARRSLKTPTITPASGVTPCSATGSTKLGAAHG